MGTESTLSATRRVRAEDNQAESKRTIGVQVNNHGQSNKALGEKESQKLWGAQRASQSIRIRRAEGNILG